MTGRYMVKSWRIQGLAAALLISCVAAAACHAQCGPAIIGHIGGQARAIAARGNFLYLGLPGELEIVDITNPAAPLSVSTLELPGMPSEIEIAGDFLYIACGDAGLRVVDITDPAIPIIASDYAGTGTTDVAVSNNKAFVLRRDEITILDTSNPSSLTVLGRFTGAIDLREVESQNNIAFVGSRDSVYVVDASTPATPVIIGQRSNLTDIEDMDVRNDLLVAADRDIVRLYDITVPAAISQVATRQANSNEFSRLAQSGGSTLLYFCNSAGLIRCDDVTTPSNPVQLSTIELRPGVIQPLGSLLFAAGSFGLSTFDMAVPTVPVGVHEAEATLNYIASMQTTADALVVSNAGRMELYDTTSPAELSLLSSTDMGTPSSRIVVEGTTAYWPSQSGSGYEVHIFDVGNPAAPVELGSFTTNTFVSQIDVVDHLVYVVGSATLKIYDATDPANAVRLSTTPCGLDDDNIVVENGFAYTTNRSNSIRVFDVRDPFSVTQIASYGTRPAQTLSGIDARDHLLFIAQSDRRLDIYDATDPSNLVLLSFIQDPTLSTFSLVDTLLTTHTFDAMINFYDTFDPTSPTLLSSRQLAGAASIATDRGSTIYVTGFALGVYSLRAPGFPRIDAQPQMVAGCLGGTAEFSVSLGNPAGASYQWKRGNVVLADGINLAGTVVSGAASRTLSLSSLHALDLGSYTCVITNSCGGAISHAASLVSATAPVITDQPDDRLICPAGSAEFAVGWTGSQPGTYQWYAEVPSGSGTFVAMSDLVTPRFTISGVNSQTLSIAANSFQTIPLQLGTRVQCVVSNSCFSVTSFPAAFSICPGDFNCDASVDFFDYLDFVQLFAAGNSGADFNADSVVDLFDYLDFVLVFSEGC